MECEGNATGWKLNHVFSLLLILALVSYKTFVIKTLSWIYLEIRQKKYQDTIKSCLLKSCLINKEMTSVLTTDVSQTQWNLFQSNALKFNFKEVSWFSVPTSEDTLAFHHCRLCSGPICYLVLRFSPPEVRGYGIFWRKEAYSMKNTFLPITGTEENDRRYFQQNVLSKNMPSGKAD